ncbi:reverse transcriptase-like protein [Candidatus Peregrinibacteria bacterium]|nr:reverse transcriptase-like protein [Candidatus Peregrinibacteria bacterium]
MDNKLIIYTDGSCLGNPGPGGWGVVILDGKKEVRLSGGERDTTNNRMEMRAIIEALEWVQQNTVDRELEINSDSNLIVQTINRGWKKKANTDLWEKIEKLRAWKNIEWNWVKAHAENHHNNIADQLAVSEARKIKKLLG